ncbi:histidine phosphatase superfamily [Daldinia vernicosa]|uniref:histidine phosphatase superfamily n=1 Tax=Daldinia vernicosa TaxID=114800 RepID=UPI0020074ABF|nr:histidine phosphatase superfamily [Daldinia vernicosa]KAI0853896.1 histidine phosphatase superfamily [Daldinia vernicosa]
MSVTIHVIRHAQGPHNVTVQARMTPDPHLTAEGLQQCARVQQTFPFAIDAIISSPQRRTIQTALICFGSFVAGGLRPQLLADLQEPGNLPCNVGVDLKTLEQEYGPIINTDNLDDHWYRTTTALSSDPTQIAERAQRARRVIRERAVSMLQSVEGQPGNHDIHIAVVTHSIFIPFLTGDYSGGTRFFRNAEWRSYTFSDLKGTDDIAALVETDQSLQRRGATRPQPTQNVAGRNAIISRVLDRAERKSSLLPPAPQAP